MKRKISHFVRHALVLSLRRDETMTERDAAEESRRENEYRYVRTSQGDIVLSSGDQDRLSTPSGCGYSSDIVQWRSERRRPRPVNLRRDRQSQ